MDNSTKQYELLSNGDKLVAFLVKKESTSFLKVVQLFSGNVDEARNVVLLLETEKIISVSRHEIEKEISSIHITQNFHSFYNSKKGGFVSRFILSKVNEIINGDESKIKERIEELKTQFPDYTSLINKQSSIINLPDLDENRNLRKAREAIISKDVISQNDILQLVQESQLTPNDIIKIIENENRFVNLKTADDPLFQKKHIDIEKIYDKIDLLTGANIDRSNKSLNHISDLIEGLFRTKIDSDNLAFNINQILDDSIRDQRNLDDNEIKKIYRNTPLFYDDIISKDTIIDLENEDPNFTKSINNEDDDLKELRFKLKLNSYNILDRNLPACFNVDKTANVLAEHLKNLSQNESGQMVGVFGKWGRGKTYFVEKLCESFDINYHEEKGNDKFHFVKFQAWKYQETPASWAYLYETIANKYLGKNEFRKFFRRLCLNIEREKWGLLKDFILILLVWGLITLLFQIIQIKSTGILGDFITFFKVNWWQTITGGTVFTSLIKFYKKKGVDALALIKKYTKGVSFDKHLGIQAEIEKELAVLLEVWMPNPNQKRLLLFVDDIDRCSEDKIISLIDSLRVMLEHPKIIERVIVLVAVDEEKLKLAIRKKYDSLLMDSDKFVKENKLKIIEREYMDKLFVSGIKLHSIDDKSKLEFAKNLLLTDYRLNNKVEFTAFEALQKIPEITIKLAENELSKHDSVSSKKEETTSDQEMKTKESATAIINPVDLENDLEIWLNSIELSEEELTPRQIRILYYRYKLAKNLLAEYWGDTNSLTAEDLDTLLEKINVKTFNPEHQNNETDTLSQIAEMVVGY
ncbi:MAG: P-loop NTPase fold protein [Prolixibacteraceae bacterium]